MSLQIIGRRDCADFPELHLTDLKVKVDTGAYTSSMHCHKIELINGELHCEFLDPSHEHYKENIHTFSSFSKRNVKSSNGIIEVRYSIKTKITLFKKNYNIELTLTDREAMKYPVLIGRKFLSRKFMVDTSQKHISFKEKYPTK